MPCLGQGSEWAKWYETINKSVWWLVLARQRQKVAGERQFQPPVGFRAGFSAASPNYDVAPPPPALPSVPCRDRAPSAPRPWGKGGVAAVSQAHPGVALSPGQQNLCHTNSYQVAVICLHLTALRHEGAGCAISSCTLNNPSSPGGVLLNSYTTHSTVTPHTGGERSHSKKLIPAMTRKKLGKNIIWCIEINKWMLVMGWRCGWNGNTMGNDSESAASLKKMFNKTYNLET